MNTNAFLLTQAAPAVYCGRQAGYLHLPAFDLYTLTADIEGHPKGSTVSEHTLRRLGFTLPSHRKGAP